MESQRSIKKIWYHYWSPSLIQEVRTSADRKIQILSILVRDKEIEGVRGSIEKVITFEWKLSEKLLFRGRKRTRKWKLIVLGNPSKIEIYPRC